MKVVYQSKKYHPNLVTGRYVRCNGDAKKGYSFRVYETATGTGKFEGKPGMGATLREYDTNGAELPEALRERCIETKYTEKWN